MTTSSEQVISQLSLRQKLNAIKDTAANIEALKSVSRSLNAFKPCVIDEDVDRKVREMLLVNNNNLCMLNDKLDAITNSFN